MRKNKKIICFVDETGIPGNSDFSLGLVISYSKTVPILDKIFSDLLPCGNGEFHSHKMSLNIIESFLEKFKNKTNKYNYIMLSYKSPSKTNLDKDEIYAYILIEAIKVISKKFKQSEEMGSIMNNIDVIIDESEYSMKEGFRNIIQNSIKSDGSFKGVNRVIPLDSNISRMIQLADSVCYLRRKFENKEISLSILEKLSIVLI